MGAAVPPQTVVRGLPGWLTPLLQSTALVLVLLGYFLWTGRMLKAIAAGATPKSSTWYRWFNEIPLLLAIPILFLVIAKPF